jgi:hypothetical protein
MEEQKCAAATSPSLRLRITRAAAMRLALPVLSFVCSSTYNEVSLDQSATALVTEEVSLAP